MEVYTNRDYAVKNCTNLYPFGMAMSGRSFNTDKYAYSFNGKPKDDEVYGDGNWQDYGMRMYNPRTGRFPSPDPLFKDYPELTTYQFGSNNPILNIDIDGLEGKPSTVLFDSKGNPRGVTSAQSTLYLPKVPNPYLKPKTDNNFDPRSYTPPPAGSIYQTPTEYERNFNFSVAPETETMIKYDPVFRGVSAGAATVTGVIATTPLVTGAINGAPAATLKIINFATKSNEFIQNAYYTLEQSPIITRIVAGVLLNEAKETVGADCPKLPGIGIDVVDVVSDVAGAAKGYGEKLKDSKQNIQPKQKEQSNQKEQPKKTKKTK